MSFRKLSLEKGSDDEQEIPQTNDTESTAKLETRRAQVKQFLSRAEYQSALNCSLQDAPVHSNQELKLLNLHIVASTLQSVKPTDVNFEQINNIEVLLKYVYKAMERPAEYPANVMLSWCEKLSDFGGAGLISRVLCGPKV